VLFNPPMAPEIAIHPELSSRAADIAILANRARTAFPALALTVLEPTGYGLKHFADSHHLSAAGSRKLTVDVQRWLRARE